MAKDGCEVSLGSSQDPTSLRKKVPQSVGSMLPFLLRLEQVLSPLWGEGREVEAAGLENTAATKD